MRAFRDLPLRQKLMRTALLASATALFGSSLAFILYDVFAFRETLLRRLVGNADIVGYNSVSALLFQDEEAAAKTLQALRSEPHVIGAAIYARDGQRFAVYRRAGDRDFQPPARIDGTQPAWHIDRGRLAVSRPIEFDGTMQGTVWIESDLEEMETRLLRYAGLVVVVSLASLGVALLLSGRFQRAIVAPVRDLARTAQLVSEAKDYSVRARGEGGDELGLLVSTFNEMLEQIQRRDAEVSEARATLERRVEERTHDLSHELAERRRTEEALRKSETLLADAQRIAQAGSWEWDLAADHLFWSRQLHRLYGTTPETLQTYEQLLARVHPDDRAAVEEAVQEARRSGKAFALDYRIRRPDGSVRTIHGDGSVELDARGRPARMIGLAQDVTERRAAEGQREEMIRIEAGRAEAQAAERRSAFLARISSALASSLDYERTLSTAASLSVPEFADWCVLDLLDDEGQLRRRAASHRDRDLEAQLGALLGAAIDREGDAPAAVAARSVATQLLPEPDASADAEHARLVSELGGGTALAVPVVVQGQARGALSWVRQGRGFDAADVLLAEEIARRAAVSIENAVLYRQAQQANRLKDEFLATLSHELRTPLHAILGWAHMLRTGRLDVATTRKALDAIGRNAQAQNELISDILDVSRIVAGKVRLSLQPVELDRVVQAALDTVRPTANAKEVELVARIQAPAPIFGDPDRLQQVVWNLLSNAIKFGARKGRVEVAVEVVEGHVRLRVEDDGPGISPEFLPFVFERFRQADSSSTRPHGGLGLGLAIVRHLVELHGGTIQARNREDTHGAVFTASFPARTVTASPDAKTSDESRREVGPALPGVSVLVVDDDPDSREMVASVLGASGAVVSTAGSAAEGLSKLQRYHPDVLLLDIEMPDQDGFQLIGLIRELPPESGGAVPAGALTAYAGAEHREKALRAGFDVHIPKPVEPAELVLAVAGLRDRNRLPDLPRSQAG